MDIVDILIIGYCILLTIIIGVYASFLFKKEPKIIDRSRKRIPVIYGSRLSYVYADSTPEEIVKFMGEPNSVNIGPQGTGVINYECDRSEDKVIKKESVKFKFSNFKLVEII